MPNQILHKTCLKAGESTGIHQYIKHGGLTNVLFWGVMFLFSGETTTFFTYILGISMYMYVTYYYFFHESISSSLVCRRLNISSCLWVEGRKTCVFFYIFSMFNHSFRKPTNQPITTSKSSMESSFHGMLPKQAHQRPRHRPMKTWCGWTHGQIGSFCQLRLPTTNR